MAFNLFLIQAVNFLRFQLYQMLTFKWFCNQLVVSIDSFWVFFRPFSYNGVYHDHTPSLPPSLSFSSTQLFFTYTHTQCSFVSHTHIYKQCSPLSFTDKKHDTFHTVNASFNKTSFVINSVQHHSLTAYINCVLPHYCYLAYFIINLYYSSL